MSFVVNFFGRWYGFVVRVSVVAAALGLWLSQAAAFVFYRYVYGIVHQFLFWFCISSLVFGGVYCADSLIRGAVLWLGHCWPSLLVWELAFVGFKRCCVLVAVCREVAAPTVVREASLHTAAGVRSSFR